MFLWFLGMSVLAVWLVFQSPAVDYRMVMLGSVLPLVELPIGPNVLHTLAGAVGVLVLVMAIGYGKPLRRRRLIGVAIGVFLHLVLDGSWTRADLFWWPVTSGGIGNGQLPELDRPLPVILFLEAVGGMVLVWLWQRFGLDDAEARRFTFRTGQMDRRAARGQLDDAQTESAARSRRLRQSGTGSGGSADPASGTNQESES